MYMSHGLIVYGARSTVLMKVCVFVVPSTYIYIYMYICIEFMSVIWQFKVMYCDAGMDAWVHVCMYACMPACK